MTLADFGLTEAAVTTLVFLYIFLILFILFCVAVLFYLKGFSIYKMSRKLKIKRSWYGFLPFFNIYAFGRIADSAEIKKSEHRKSLITVYALSRLAVISYTVSAIVFSVKLFFAADTAVFQGKELDPEIFGGLIPSIIVFAVSAILTIIYYIINSVCAAKIYRLFGINAAKTKAVLGFFIPLFVPIFLYSACKGEPNENKSSLKDDDSVIFRIDE